MRVPLSWLKDFAPFAAPAEDLAEALDELGLVVEEVKPVGTGLSNVLVALVLSIEPIPGADKIRKVTVDAGQGPLEIVCGAWNFSEGALVPLAPVGTVLPGGLEIDKKKVRGVTSNGMLCSGKELELSDDQEGILVLGSVDGESPGADAGDSPAHRAPSWAEPGTSLVEALGIEVDVVFDIAVDANRPDAASVAGIARDLAAKLHLPFEIPEPSGVPSSAHHGGAEVISLEVRDPDLCPMFTARVMSGVEVVPSPPLVSRRLLLAGMRPINNVVDASNYVMLELGQPTHPYDLDRVAGQGLIVRAGRPGESVVTLDGVRRVVGERPVVRGDDLRDCLICDAGDLAIGIGGLMGGASSEIDSSTRRVALEAAYFAPMAIARTSKRLGVRTEASSRFERGVDPRGIDRASRRICELLADSAGDSMSLSGAVVVAEGEVPGPRRVRVRRARVNAVLGTDLSDDEVAGTLEPIGFRCDLREPGELLVEVPTFRPDTEREIDVIEEVARHHGYVRIPRRRVFPPQVGGLTGYQRRRRFVREILAGTGADEAWTASLLARGDHERAGIRGDTSGFLELTNPLTPEESVLRRSLLPGLLKAVSFNFSRRGRRIRFFEIGHVFPAPSAGHLEAALVHEDPAVTVVEERELLGVILANEDDDARAAVRTWRVLVDALGLQGVELSFPSGTSPLASGGLHPTRSANIVISATSDDSAVLGRDPSSEKVPAGTVLGVVGEVDPDVLEAFAMDPSQHVGWLEVDLSLLLEGVRRKPQTAAPISRFPSNDIDLAFIVDESVPAAAVTKTLTAAGGELLESIELFDAYRDPPIPAGTRGLTWRLRFCADDHTLTDAEVGVLRSRCIEAVERAHEAHLRG